MNWIFAMSAAASAAAAVLLSASAHAQKNYTDGGDLYGGSHAPAGKEIPAKQAKKPRAHRSEKFDTYTDGKQNKASLAPATKKLPDERPQPDDVAKTGRFDPYTDGRSK